MARPAQEGGASSSGANDPPPPPPPPAEEASTTLSTGLAAFRYVDRVLLASNARSHSVWLTNPYVRPDVHPSESVEDFVRAFRLDKKADVPTNFRTFTLLLFKSEAHFTAGEFWIHFAETIGLRPEFHEEGIAVCTFPEMPNDFVVAYMRNAGQRNVQIPAGFCGRYVPAATKKGGTRFPMSAILARVRSLGATQVTNMRIDNFGQEGREVTAIEALTATQNLSEQELSLQRVAASMVAPNERTPLERALTNGWGALGHALKLSEESPIPNRCSIHDKFPVLSSYGRPNTFHAFNYMDIDLDCWVYDANADTNVRMRL